MSRNTVLDPSRALLLLSGGQDSATCLAWALDRFAQVETVGFRYGQRHDVELQARDRVREGVIRVNPAWADRLGTDHSVDLSGFGAIGETAMTSLRAIEIGADGLPTTFVPGRNLMFLVAAGALAYRRDLGAIVIGACETDFSGYPDCRETAIEAQAEALRCGLDAELTVEAPLMRLTKAQTWALADRLGGAALVELIRVKTHTCYRGVREQLHAWGYGCGACPACDLRRAGWDAFVGAPGEAARA